MHVHLESEELSNLGKPLYTFDSDLVCNFQDRAKTVLTTEKKLVQITGTALFPGLLPQGAHNPSLRSR